MQKEKKLLINFRRVRFLEQEIENVTQKLKKLLKQKKEQKRRELEFNKKNVYELIRAERLDHISIEQWKKMILDIKKILFLK